MYSNTHAKTSTCYMQECMHIDAATDSAEDSPVETCERKHPITRSWPRGQSILYVCVYKERRVSEALENFMPAYLWQAWNISTRNRPSVWAPVCVCKWWHKGKPWLMFHFENICVDLLMATMSSFKESAKETEKDTEFKDTLTYKGSN